MTGGGSVTERREKGKVGRKKRIPPRIYLRYILMNAPGLAAFILVLIILKRWFALPGWLVWSLVAAWIIKDALLFPVVWRAYDWNGPGGAAPMAGERGIVKERLDPSGYVQVRGELWRAERDGDGPPIEPGRPVRVRKRDGFTLYVTPDEDGERQ